MPSATIEFHDDELFIGYLSRYARGLGLSGVFDLLLDLSVPRKGTLNGAAADIQKISAILEADVDHAMRQTFQKGAGQNVLLGGLFFKINASFVASSAFAQGVFGMISVLRLQRTQR